MRLLVMYNLLQHLSYYFSKNFNNYLHYRMSKKQNSMIGVRSNRWTTGDQGGGMKLSGIPNNLSSAGVGMIIGRTYLGGPPGLMANYKNKNIVFYINQTIDT